MWNEKKSNWIQMDNYIYDIDLNLIKSNSIFFLAPLISLSSQNFTVASDNSKTECITLLDPGLYIWFCLFTVELLLLIRVSAYILSCPSVLWSLLWSVIIFFVFYEENGPCIQRGTFLLLGMKPSITPTVLTKGRDASKILNMAAPQSFYISYI